METEKQPVPFPVSERIHRSNLVGMGVLPLQFLPGENRDSVGITGRESFDLTGIADGLRPQQKLTLVARDDQGKEKRFEVVARIDSPVELVYYQNGGILHAVLRAMARGD